MKVAFLSREYPPETAWGGLATVYHSLAYALAQRGHEVHVICQASTEPLESIEDGVFIHRVGITPRRYSAASRINYNLHAWQKLKDIINHHGIDIVEASYWGAEAFLYSLKKGVPLVIRTDVSARDLLLTKTYSGLREGTALKALSFLEDYTIRRADRVIAISRDMYAGVINRLQIPKDKVDIIPHGIDTSRYHFVESEIRQRFDIPQNIPLVLFVGRLETRKGIYLICQIIPEVIRSIPAARFVLVGRDTRTAPGGSSVRSYLSESARQNGFASNLQFIDFLPSDELVAMYSACDVFVLPSFQEGCSMVILEALACGKPLVTTNTGGVSDLKLDSVGGVIISPDTKSLAAGIIRMLSLKDAEKKLIARKNRELIETGFSIFTWADKVIRVYEKALNER